MRKASLLLLPMLLAGCTVAVEYGDIPHNVLAENPRCNPAQNDSASGTRSIMMLTVLLWFWRMAAPKALGNYAI